MNYTKIIDIHSHFTTPEYLNMLKKHNAALEDGFPVPLWNIQEHLNLMEQCNIHWTLLSLSTPQPYFNGFEQESIDMCRQLNEQMAQIKRDYPHKFGFQATLPLPDISASIEEAIYALDCLDADGIKFPSNSRGLYLGAEELEPLMAELNKKHAICNIHPHRPEPIKEGIFSAGPVPLFEFLANTTRAVLNLVSNGVILRYPNVKWIIPHCGSFLPNIYDRFSGLSKVLIPQGLMQPVDIEKSFGQLYFDLSGNPAPHLLEWLLTITTPEHIMYGSDFPFTPANQIRHNLNDLLQMLEKESLIAYKNKILFENAQDLFQI